MNLAKPILYIMLSFSIGLILSTTLVHYVLGLGYISTGSGNTVHLTETPTLQAIGVISFEEYSNLTIMDSRINIEFTEPIRRIVRNETQGVEIIVHGRPKPITVNATIILIDTNTYMKMVGKGMVSGLEAVKAYEKLRKNALKIVTVENRDKCNFTVLLKPNKEYSIVVYIPKAPSNLTEICMSYWTSSIARLSQFIDIVTREIILLLAVILTLIVVSFKGKVKI